ncbi:unnamed protein product [Peniophora sp. CBMAI 1063]|nr:unnamed protein product [Peniophora sp. CBMAI 1063]
MIPTVVRMSKASRRPLTSKMANKDYYKGTRQAWLQPDLRTGPPGKHTKHGGYRLIEEQVRVFVAPPLEDINNSKLKPYVAFNAKLTDDQKQDVLPSLPQGGLNGKHLLALMRGEVSKSDSYGAFEPANSLALDSAAATPVPSPGPSAHA